MDNAEKLELDFFATLRSNQKFNAVINSFAKCYQFDEKKVIALHIESSPDKPIYFNNPQNTFIRMGSGDQRATNTEIDAMFRNKSYGVKSEQAISDEIGIGSLNSESLRSYRTYMRNFDLLKNATKEFVKASRLIYELITQNPHISASQMSEALNVTARQVQKYLKRLQELQKVTRQGGRKQGEWIILDKDFLSFLDMI